MKRYMLGLAAVCMLPLLLAACGGTGTSTTTQAAATATPTIAPATATPTTASTGAATITMARSSFVGGTSVTIKAGQAVTFNDPSSGGGFHNLVTGTQGAFKAEPGTPSQLSSSSGMAFSPGQVVDITFTTPGTYDITCTIHPSMQATITVTS